MNTVSLNSSFIIERKLIFGRIMNIGAHIKKLRKEMGLTQDAFAKRVKFHPKQLARYEAGKNIPSAEIVARIAQFCEVPTDVVILGTDASLGKRAKLTDLELIDLLRRINQLNKGKRERLKWAIEALLEKETAFAAA